MIWKKILGWSVSDQEKLVLNHISTWKNHKNTLNMFIAFNNLKIVSKTHNQSEIKILFGFKSTIPGKFKGKTTPCLNSTHQTEPIETKITYFCGQNRSQPRLSLYHQNLATLPPLFQTRNQKKKHEVLDQN